MKVLFYFALCIGIASCKQQGIDARVLTLPSFNLQALDSSHTLNTKNIENGQPTVLLYFNADCAFSRRQIEQIVAHYQLFSAINVYMCSEDPLYKLKAVYGQYGLNRFHNITVARDKDLFFQEQLKVPSFPWMFIYGADRKLKKIIQGNVDPQFILDIIKS